MSRDGERGGPVPGPGVPALAGHLFRREAGKLVSALTGAFGLHRLQLAEDVVQEAMVRALKTWPYYGVPDNPPAWLMRTAKNLALDAIRRETWFRERLPEITASLEQIPDDPAGPGYHDELRDHRLRLIFACCHPSVPVGDQAALALKTLCGFGVAETGSALLLSEAAVAKRLTRAKRRIREEGIPFEIPAGPELETRLDGVLRVIYLLFNEGYKASHGDRVTRAELCHEALRLGGLLVSHPAADHPRTHALLALMWMNVARLGAREGDGGHLLRLQDQDRNLWDRPMIARGLGHLVRSASGDQLSEYHLQAGITALHCTAPDFASTDWPEILAHYDRWAALSDSPVVALNRAVALAHVEGPDAALEALTPIQESGQLDGYHLLDAVLGDLSERRGDAGAAAFHFRRALGLAANSQEREFLERRLAGVAAGAGPARGARASG